MKKTLRWGIAMAALVAGACLAGMPAMAEDCIVKIGNAGPMTGGGSSWGLAMKAGVDFEAAVTNAAGGLQMGDKKCKVVVIAVDSMSTAAGAAAAANYLASQGVHATNGPVVGPESTGFKPVGKRNKIVSFTPTFAADAIGPDFPHAFHEVQGPPIWGTAAIKAVRERFKINSAVIIAPNDQGGTDTVDALTKLYEAAGVKTGGEYYQRGTTNFSPLAIRIMGMNVDAVDFTSLPPGEAAILAKQLREAGYEGAFGRLGAGGDVIIANTGGPTAQKSFYWFDHIPTEDPAAIKMKEDFERVMKQPMPDNLLVYNAMITSEILLKAIQKAGTDQDGDKIADALRSTTPESRYFGAHGWRGKAQFGVNQEFSFPVGVHFIRNGKSEPGVKIEIPAES